jgi:hypothetical protein
MRRRQFQETRDERDPQPSRDEVRDGGRLVNLTGDPRPDPNLPEVVFHRFPQDISRLPQDHFLIGQFAELDLAPASQPVRRGHHQRDWSGPEMAPHGVDAKWDIRQEAIVDLAVLDHLGQLCQ